MRNINPLFDAINLIKKYFKVGDKEARAIVLSLKKTKSVKAGDKTTKLIDKLETRKFGKGIHKQRPDDYKGAGGYGKGTGELDPGDIGVLEDALKKLMS